MSKFFRSVLAWVRKEPVVTSGIAGAVVLNIAESVFHLSPGVFQLVMDGLLAAGVPVLRSMVKPATKSASTKASATKAA